ncbi:MAG: hypothetical protein ACTS81_00270 [Arsenophonus sp. ER-BJ3-MAG3]
MVAGSNPAGATKFSEVIHAIRPPLPRWLFCLSFKVVIKWRQFF